MTISKITPQNNFGDVFNTINTIIDELEEANVVFNDISGNTISLNQLNANTIDANVASLSSLAISGGLTANSSNINGTVSANDFQGQTANINNIISANLTVSILTTNTISIANKIDTLTVNTIHIDNLIANTDATNIYVNDIKAFTSNLDYLQNITFVSNTGIIHNLNADGITANTISTEKLIMRGSDNIDQLVNLVLEPGNSLGTGANNDLILYPISLYSKKLATFTSANSYITEFNLTDVARKSDLTQLGKLATQNNISISDINAGGTANGSTYLAGDGAWKPVISDMTKAVYDPRKIQKDAFNMDNMTTGNINAVFSLQNQNDLNNTKIKVDNIDLTSLLPRGSIILYSVSTPPDGYLICNGAAVLKNSFPELSALLTNIYGASNNTHFYLPDFRDKLPAGWNSVTNAIGDSSNNAYQPNGNLSFKKLIVNFCIKY